MPKIRRVDYSPDEFLAGTVMLTDAECGLYWRACSLIYSTGGPIKRAHLKAVSKAHGNTFNACLDRLIKLGKLEGNDDEIDQKRARFEIEKAEKRVRTAGENGAKGGRPNKLENQTGYFPEKLTNNYQLPTNRISTNVDSSAERRRQCDDMVRVWIEAGLPPIRRLSPQRQKKMLARLAEDLAGSIVEWKSFVDRIARSKFLRGETGRWRADLDWAIEPRNVLHVLEGRFDDRSVSSSTSVPEPRLPRRPPSEALLRHGKPDG